MSIIPTEDMEAYLEYAAEAEDKERLLISNPEIHQDNKLTRQEPQSRLNQSIKLSYLEIQAVTKEDNNKAGAIRLAVYNPKTKIEESQWIPKKCCSNLEGKTKTIYVWEVFANEHLGDFI